MPDDIRATGATRTVHLEREYQATPDELWAAWTDPASLARWLGTPAAPLLGATAPVRMIMGDGADQWVDVRIVTADRPTLLELAWDFPGETGSVLRVRFERVDATRTRVVLDHSGLTTSSTGYGAGWQSYLEGGLAGMFDPTVDTDWDRRFERNLALWRERAAAMG